MASLHPVSALELTRRLLQFKTINPPGDERACALYLASLLEAAGFTTACHEFADGRTTLVARAGGGRGGLPLLMTGHLDTVPLGKTAWSRDPFAGETDGDRIYGRGASDMKGGVAAMVLAALASAGEVAGGPGLVLVLTAGEETGHEGVKHLAQTPDALGPVGAIIVGEPTENYPLIGSRGSLKLEFIVPGVTAHASTPEAGVNAVVRAARLAAALDEYRFDVDPHPVMGRPTMNIGYLHGGMNVNSVPDEARLGIDIRTVLGQDHDHIQHCCTAWPVQALRCGACAKRR
ncbi:MAG: M20/M25/M40 family metallo-hydrolase [Burkholderiaceae bacterium]|nr:M20/M25/M40 family metallo-hydrolase [Burkholderiaceae bacterium]